jgi:cytochrome c biogenesis protein CcdA
MAIMLMLFSTGAALVRDGLVRSVRRVMPYMGRITGAMLTVAGLYLTYYWGRVKFGSAATLGDDPIVGFVGDFTATIERYAGTYGRPVMVILGVVLLGILGAMLWKRLTGSPQAEPIDPSDADSRTDAADEQPSKHLQDSLS